MLTKIGDWFKNNWILWLLIILFYVGLRLSGYDILIVKTSHNVVESNSSTKPLVFTNDEEGLKKYLQSLGYTPEQIKNYTIEKNGDKYIINGRKTLKYYNGTYIQ